MNFLLIPFKGQLNQSGLLHQALGREPESEGPHRAGRDCWDASLASGWQNLALPFKRVNRGVTLKV